VMRQRMRRFLRRRETDLGKKLIFGDPPKPHWTTYACLRAAGVIDDYEAMTRAIAAEFDDIRGELDLLHERQHGLANALASISKNLHQGNVCGT
jgi:hypothetical protein